MKDWPKVTIEIREKYYVGETRTENEWPIARTQYTKYFLDAGNGSLSKTRPEGTSPRPKYNVDRNDTIQDASQYSKYFLEAVEAILTKTAAEDPASTKYRVGGLGTAVQNARFEIEFSERIELTGHMNLRLWVQADGSDDLDLVRSPREDRRGRQSRPSDLLRQP